MAVEEPQYTVSEAEGAFELRIYNPMIVAETLVQGSMNEASSAGFKLIADYIFGNNTSATSSNEKISMTAPVAMAPESEKISMTAPVNMHQTGEQWHDLIARASLLLVSLNLHVITHPGHCHFYAIMK